MDGTGPDWHSATMNSPFVTVAMLLMLVAGVSVVVYVLRNHSHSVPASSDRAVERGRAEARALGDRHTAGWGG